jgi:hypothetical protein
LAVATIYNARLSYIYDDFSLSKAISRGLNSIAIFTQFYGFDTVPGITQAIFFNNDLA